MALNTRLEFEINEQINREFYSAYLYLSMAAYFERQGLKGFANKMYVQYQEESTHAQKFYRYVNEKGGKVVLKAIAEVKHDWKNAVEVFEDVVKHEEFVTNCIHNLANISMEEKDHATLNLLQWYINEQVEEEAVAGEILAKLKLINGEGAGLFLMDKDLSAVTFVDSTLSATA